jgi:Uma2 family endonuclease
MNIAVVDPAPDLPPRRAFTVHDIRRMVDAGVISEDENIELVEGEIIVMAAKGYAHEMVRKALGKAVTLAAMDDFDVGIEMTVQFAPDILLEPDVAVFPLGRLQKSDAGFVEAGHGDCLFVIEIAATSLAYDKGRKAKLYARYGVQEFWVVDANERVTWVHSGRSDDRWSSIVKRSADEMLTTPALPRLAIRLSDI